jgi:hypothetical protein
LSYHINMAGIEKRKFTRVPFRTIVRLTIGDAVVTSNHLHNISLGGAHISFTGDLPEQTACAIEFELTGPASLLKIQVEGEIVRSDLDGIAVQFTKIDLDSLIYLRHLVRVHARDPEDVNGEYFKNLLEIDEEE